MLISDFDKRIYINNLEDMREIINIQLGQCGNNIGHQFLKAIAAEHSISTQGRFTGTSDYQKERLDVFFNETQDNLFNFRSILVDSEAGAIDNIRGKPFGGLYDCDNFVVGMGSAGNNWAQGFYGKGAEYIEYVMDAIRRQAENCDNLEGFQLIHSTGGGTGSGLGSLLLQRIKTEYSHIIQNFTVLPSEKTSTNIVEVYNTVLSFPSLVQHTQLCHLLSNEAMQKICVKKQKLTSPTFKDLNTLVTNVMSGVSSGFRFPGQMNSSLRKLAVNLVPFPRIHFFINSVSPYLSNKVDLYRTCSQKQTIIELFDPPYNLSGVDRTDGRYMSASVVLRGKISTYAAQDYIRATRSKNQTYFIHWILNNISSSYCNIPFSDHEISGVLVANNSSVVQIYKRLGEKFSASMRKKAYMHWYTSQGMDEMQFVESQSHLNDLQQEYNYGDGCDCCGQEEEIQQE